MNLVDITDDVYNQRMKIPTNDDKSLPLQTLQCYFPGANGLFYLGEGGEKIAVRFDESMTKLVPPAEGWDGKLFFISRPKVPSLADDSIDAQPDWSYSRAPSSPSSRAKYIQKWMFFAQKWIFKNIIPWRPQRRSFQIMNLVDITDDVSNQRMKIPTNDDKSLPSPPSSWAKYIQEWMFFARDDAGKSCVICVHPHFFATFRHGPHLQLNLGESLTIYKAESDADESFLATVAQIDEKHDFILLKSETRVVEKGPSLRDPRRSESFLLADYGKEQQNLSYQFGVVDDLEHHFFLGENNGPNPTGSPLRGPFFFATGLRSAGDSVGACWGGDALVGIKLGCIPAPTAPHDSTISDATVYSSKIYMVSAIYLSMVLAKERGKDPKLFQSKKRCYLIHIEGKGIGELRSGFD